MPFKLISLCLQYDPPYDWQHHSQFYARRAISGLEWHDDKSYGRTFRWKETRGYFTARHIAGRNCFELEINLENAQYLDDVVSNIRRMFDLNADATQIYNDLEQFDINKGMRIPGTWDMFEAGIRAILGQQISVTAAHKLVSEIVKNLGEPYASRLIFPTPSAINKSSLAFLKIPNSRKHTLKNLSQHYLYSEKPDDPLAWLQLKGIGPWTVDYAQMRGLSHPDIYLGGDLGVKKAQKNLPDFCDPNLASPWRSYLTLQLWRLL